MNLSSEIKNPHPAIDVTQPTDSASPDTATTTTRHYDITQKTAQSGPIALITYPGQKTETDRTLFPCWNSGGTITQGSS